MSIKTGVLIIMHISGQLKNQQVGMYLMERWVQITVLLDQLTITRFGILHLQIRLKLLSIYLEHIMFGCMLQMVVELIR